jgi:hypothetical protein
MIRASKKSKDDSAGVVSPSPLAKSSVGSGGRSSPFNVFSSLTPLEWICYLILLSVLTYGSMEVVKEAANFVELSGYVVESNAVYIRRECD